MKDENGDYIEPKDVLDTLEKFPVTSVKFSLALLKARGPSMDAASFDRCIRTMMALVSKMPFK